jgi:hypothetical protein
MKHVAFIFFMLLTPLLAQEKYALMHRLTWEEYAGTLAHWRKAFPKVAALESRGMSGQNMPVYLLKITDPTVKSTDKQVCLVTTLHSGPERTGTTGAMAFAEWCLSDDPLAVETRKTADRAHHALRESAGDVLHGSLSQRARRRSLHRHRTRREDMGCEISDDQQAGTGPGACGGALGDRRIPAGGACGSAWHRFAGVCAGAARLAAHVSGPDHDGGDGRGVFELRAASVGLACDRGDDRSGQGGGFSIGSLRGGCAAHVLGAGAGAAGQEALARHAALLFSALRLREVSHDGHHAGGGVGAEPRGADERPHEDRQRVVAG